MKAFSSTASLLATTSIVAAHDGSDWGRPGYGGQPPHFAPPGGRPWGWPTQSAPSSAPTFGSGHGGQSCSTLTADEINSMGNNSLFTRWRPQSHFIPPAGWMNDPSGAMYDPVRDEYHMSYQWHPEHFNWGNISWGSAKSKDLVTWTDHGSWKGRDALVLGPSGNGSYDGLGIFSGTAQPVNLQGEQDGTLLAFYTSVSYLPTNWQIHYEPYTETQSLAISHDGGETWEKYAGNPVINATTNTAPMHWNVTGFRDPFFEPMPDLDAILGVSEPHYYAVFGSGIKGVGPRMPLWTAPASDLASWTFLGALWEPAANTTLGSYLTTGSYAFNFEVSGFFPLSDSRGNQYWFVNMGTEGGNLTWHQSAQWALWNGGSVSRRDNGSAEFVPTFGGAGDWGVGYALTSFNDTKHNRRVQYAWLKEDYVANGGLFSVPQQGFQGALSLPRELFVHEVENVDVSSELTDSKTASIVDGTAMTLGIRPLPDVVAGLRQNSSYTSHGCRTYTSSQVLARSASAHMELRATVSSFTGGAFGLVLAASPDGSELTTITYQPSNHTILVDRSHSSSVVGFNNATLTGYFRPYTLASNASEAVVFDVFVDGSIVEVYVNERFALTARIYPGQSCSTGYGVVVAEGASVEMEVESWVGTKNVWPERPLNSSSQLVWDSPEETNDYVWWTGN